LGARDADGLAPLRAAAGVLLARLEQAPPPRRRRGGLLLGLLDLAVGFGAGAAVQPRVVPLTLERVRQHLPRRVQPRRLGPGAAPRPRLVGPALPRLAPSVLEPLAVSRTDLVLRRARLDAEQLVKGLAHGVNSSSRCGTSLSIGTRSWVMESRSRTVTARSSS